MTKGTSDLSEVTYFLTDVMLRDYYHIFAPIDVKERIAHAKQYSTYRRR